MKVSGLVGDILKFAENMTGKYAYQLKLTLIEVKNL